MCEPATLTMVAVGFSAASAGASAYGTYQQGKANNAVAENNQRMLESNAKLEEDRALDAKNKGELDAQAVRRNASQVEGAQRVALAANGLDLQSGTAFDLVGQTDFFGRADAATARSNASKEAWAINNNAANMRAQGQNYSGRANPGRAAGLSLLGSASSVADKWYTYNRPSGATAGGTTTGDFARMDRGQR